MIIYIDFTSIGDASFYRLHWETTLTKSNSDCYKIYSDTKFSLNKSFLTIPDIFVSNRFLNNIFKFLFHTLIIFILVVWIRLLRKNNTVLFNLHQPFIYWNILRIFKNKYIKIVGIIHDVIQFNTSNYPSIIITSNSKIINFLDSVVLHSGEEVFYREYNFLNKIYILPFPERKPYDNKLPVLQFNYILLPGRYRKEKGFDFVICNWPNKENTIPLVIMTKVPDYLEELIAENKYIVYKPKFSSNEFFENLILHCSAALLMYFSGTNSGILQTLIANQKKVIVSNIPLFCEHPYSDYFVFCDHSITPFQNLINNFDTYNISQNYPLKITQTEKLYGNFLSQISID